jgi:hypothetical protein
MGFFSKAFKKIKKGFKSAFKGIGKGIKSAFKKFGKFMGKIGVVGQIAMMFVLPVVGQALSSTLGGAFSSLVGKGATMTTAGTSATVTAGTGMLGSTSAIVRGAGHVLKAAGNFTKMVHSGFKTVTDGIGSFVGEMAGAAINKIPGAGNFLKGVTGGRLDITNKTFTSAWNAVEKGIMENAGKVMTNFNNMIGNVAAPTSSVISGQVANAKAVTGSGTTPGSVAKVKPTTTPTAPSGKMSVTELSDAIKAGTVDGSVMNVNTKKGFFDFSGPSGGPTSSGFKAGYDASGMRISNKSLLEKGFDSAVDFVKEIPGKALERGKEYIADIPQRLGDYAVDSLETAAIEKIVGTEEQEYKSYGNSFVGYQSAGIQDYGSPEINDRAYQYNSSPQNFMMQNPVGYAAQSYNSRMQGSYAMLPAIG